MRQVLSEDDSFLILDSFSVTSLRKCLSAGYPEYDIALDEQDAGLLDLLQINLAHVKTEDEERESVPANQIAYMQELSDNKSDQHTEPANRFDNAEWHDYPCICCGKSFKTPDNLTVHEKLHTTKRVTCKTCGKTFTSQKRVENHEKRMHSEAQGIYCEICGKTLRSKDNLILHIQLLH